MHPLRNALFRYGVAFDNNVPNLVTLGSLPGPFLTKKRLSIETKSFTMSISLPHQRRVTMLNRETGFRDRDGQPVQRVRRDGHGRPLVQRLHRGLQQQNKGPQARLLRDAELPELQKSDPFLQRCTEKTAPGLSTPTRSWMIVFFASTPTIDIEPDKCRSCRQGKAARLSRSAAQSTFRSAKSSWNSACQKVPESFP